MFFPEYLLIQCIASYLTCTLYMLRLLNLFGFNNVNNITSWLKLRLFYYYEIHLDLNKLAMLHDT